MSYVVSTACEVWNSEVLCSTNKIFFLEPRVRMGLLQDEKVKFSAGLNTTL